MGDDETLIRSKIALALLLLILLALMLRTAEASSNPHDALINATVYKCLHYLPYVQYWSTHTKYGYPDLDPALVLAVGAAESGCESWPVSSAGAVGWMQVLPRQWMPPDNVLAQDSYNTLWGMRILNGAIENARGDWLLGVAYYNCSAHGVDNGGCGDNGGIAYAEHVLTLLYRPMQEALHSVAKDEHELYDWLENWHDDMNLTRWLMKYGYGLPEAICINRGFYCKVWLDRIR